MEINKKEENVFNKLKKHQQTHVLYFWNKLNEKEKNNLISELNSIDLEKTDTYYNNFLKHIKKEYEIKPAKYLSKEEKKSGITDLEKTGKTALTNNEIAFLTVAGGQGSRLGYEHPKGTFPISIIKKKPLFQIFAEKIKFYSNYYNNNFYWYIMTSEYNYSETVSFFKKNNHFGLSEKHIIFFKQGMLPTVTEDGKLILQNKNKIFLNPDGHGGILKALLKNGLLTDMKKRGIKHLSYFQVDNLFVNMADPYFIGYHIKEKSMVSSKVIAKLYPEEKLGSICTIDGINNVIEYSDLPEDKMYKKDKNGTLEYLMGSIAIHIFDVNFLENFTKKIEIHFAEKKVKGYDFSNTTPSIKKLNAIKFETFVFDSIPLASKSVFYETEREIEFFPLKNKTGVDSIETCIEGQNNIYKDWIKSTIHWNDKINSSNIEISPLFAPDKNFFLEKVKEYPDKINKAIYDKNGNIRNEIFIE